MHQPTSRVIRALQTVAVGGEMKLSDISCKIGIPKSTLLPILQTLTELGYLRQNERGAYSVGLALYSLGAAANGSFPALDFVKEKLRLLADGFGETCYFGVLDGNQVLYLEKADSSNPLRMLVTTGSRLPAYSTGIGKALLIDKDQEELSSLYPDGLRQITSKTITRIGDLANELHQSRLIGYVKEVEESTEHIRCYGAPIRKNGKTVAAISIAFPTFRYDDEKGERAIAAIVEAAREIGAVFEKTDFKLDNIF